MDYYISKNNGKYSGPFKKEQLIAAGLDLDTMVWRQGMTAWAPAKQLPELSDIIGDVPPPMDMVMEPNAVVQPPVQQVTAQLNEMQQQLNQLNREKEELKKLLEQKKAEGDKKLAIAKAQHQAEVKEQKKQKEKKEKEEKEKAKKKTRYDYPVCDWRNESIWLLFFVICHAAMAIAGWTTFFYIYFDIVGAVLSIIGIVIGNKIRKLNAISYKKGSESRLKAEPLGYYNGIFVSVTAAIGFLIILVQSAHYVYVC